MAYFVLVITLLIWSGSFLAARWARESLSVGEALAARFVPVLVSGLLLIAWRWKSVRKLPRAAWGKIIWMGILSVPVYNLFFFMAMKDVATGTAALIIATNPVFTALLAAPLLGEPFGKRRAGGLLLGLAGVFIVIRYGIGAGAGASLAVHYWRSALLLLLAPLSWAGYTIIGKSLPADCNRLDASLAQLVIGSAPLAFFFTPSLGHTLMTHPLALWSSLYLGLLCTLFGFAAWLWALGRLSATQTAAFVFLNPPLANLWAWLLGETNLTPVYLLGAALLLCGVALIVFGRKN